MSTEIVKHETASNVLEVIQAAARDPEVDPAKMQALLNVQERFYRLSAEAEFNKALVELQANLPRIGQSATGAHDIPYATYEDIDNIVRPLLRDHGFAWTVNSPDTSGGMMKFEGKLRHRAGHSESYNLALPIDGSGGKSGTHGGLSTASYAKRALLKLALNIVEQEREAEPEPTITDEQVMKLETLIKDTGARLANILQFAGVDSLSKITASKYEVILQKLMARRGK